MVIIGPPQEEFGECNLCNHEVATSAIFGLQRPSNVIKTWKENQQNEGMINEHHEVEIDWSWFVLYTSKTYYAIKAYL